MYFRHHACSLSIAYLRCCDGDAIIMKQEELLTILDRLYKTFPYLEKVTTYAGPKSTMSKTPAQLKELNEAGLKRAYLGVETGEVLTHRLQNGEEGCHRPGDLGRCTAAEGLRV